MARFLKYYREENKRHSTANSMRLTFDQALAMSTWLMAKLGLPQIPVTLLDRQDKRFGRVRKVKSWYQPVGKKVVRGRLVDLAQEIVLHPDMLSPLTVVHEVAHYADDMERRPRLEAINAEYMQIKSENWHGPKHEALVNKGIDLVKTFPHVAEHYETTERVKNALVPLIDEEARLTVIRAAAEKLKNQILAEVKSNKDPVVAFFNSLPSHLHCPCCQKDVAKDLVGVRVMKRDANGLPVSIRRQSHCKACR